MPEANAATLDVRGPPGHGPPGPRLPHALGGPVRDRPQTLREGRKNAAPGSRPEPAKAPRSRRRDDPERRPDTPLAEAGRRRGTALATAQQHPPQRRPAVATGGLM